MDTKTTSHAIGTLAKYPQWVVWQYEERPDKKTGEVKRTKVPKNPNTGGNAMSNNAETWGTYEEALAKKGEFDGIGFMLDPDQAHIVGIDIDHCIDEAGNLSDLAREVITTVSSYTEVTPSGKGIRIFAWGDLPKGRRKDDKLGFEIYDRGRFLTITGNHLPGSPDAILGRTDQIKRLHAKIFPEKPKKESRQNGHIDNLDDKDLITRIEQSDQAAKFQKLWAGDWNGMYNSQSQADQALMNMLYFWTQGDEEQTKRLFKQSGLGDRDKADREDYINRTYAKASEGEVRDPNYRRNGDSQNGRHSTNGGGAAPAADQGPTEETPADERVFKIYSLPQFMARPKKEWIIDNLIGKTDTAMLFGESGTGKTFVTFDLLFSAALGRPFANKFNIARPLNVVYCAGEGVGGLPNRLAAAMGKFGKSADQIPLTILDSSPQLFDGKAEANVYTFVRELSEQSEQIDLLVIDTLHSASAGADENHAKDAGIVLAAARYIRDNLGCAVLFDHHTNRAGAYRGSSAWHGSMDLMFQTHPEGSVFKLDCFKLKDAEKFKPLFFRLVPEHVSESVYVEWVDEKTVDLNEKKSAVDIAESAIIELLAEKPGLKQSDIVEALAEKVGRQTVLKALNKLETGGEVEAKQQGNSKLYQLRMDL